MSFWKPWIMLSWVINFPESIISPEYINIIFNLPRLNQCGNLAGGNVTIFWNASPPFGELWSCLTTLFPVLLLLYFKKMFCWFLQCQPSLVWLPPAPHHRALGINKRNPSFLKKCLWFFVGWAVISSFHLQLCDHSFRSEAIIIGWAQITEDCICVPLQHA